MRILGNRCERARLALGSTSGEVIPKPRCANIPVDVRNRKPARMRLSQSPPTLLSLLAVILSSTHTAQAKPYPREESILDQRDFTLEARQCPQANLCGWSKQLCCTSGTTCITDQNGQAQCAASNQAPAAITTQVGNVNGQWQYFTTTYVQTDLVTIVTTYSSFVGYATPTVQTLAVPTTYVPVATPTTPATAICNPNLNEVSCGPICCASGQFCQYAGSCAAAGGSSAAATYFVPASSASASAFIRPTSNTVQTVISTGTATTTIPFQTPIGTDGSAVTGMTAVQQNNGLSGGAIAGIVIGVLLLLFILFIICLCCCAKGLLDRILGIFGLGPRARKRRVETSTYVEEHHHSHGGTGAAAAGGRTWYGGRRNDGPSRPAKKTNGFGGALGVAGALAALAVLLGLKRRRDRDEKSSYGTGSSYTYSDYTSASK